jgi:uncharacterized cupredoxin-like copper-binding protein
MLAVVIVASLVLAACGGGSAAASGREITIKAVDIKYDTTTLSAKVGETLTITLENDGALEHSFVIDELNVKIEHVQPGQKGSATFTLTSPGTYTYYCDVPGHRQAKMVGTLTVTP